MEYIDSALFPKAQLKALSQLQEAVESGSLQLHDNLGNEQTLADRLAVSRNTVRKLLAELTTAGIVEQMPRRGIFLRNKFQIGGGAESDVPTQRSIYIRWCDSLMESEISCGLERFCRNNELNLEILAMHQSLPTMLELIKLADAQTVVILAPVDTPEVKRELELALRRGVKILQVDRFIPGLTAPSVVFDDYSVGVLATRHLLQQFNRPVWYFGYKHPISAGKRYQGWFDCMAESGYQSGDKFIIPCNSDDVDAEQRPQEFYVNAFREFYRSRLDEPLSIFCMCDTLALNIYQVAAEFHRSIGKDLFIVGSGDIACARTQTPPLSSIHADQVRMGEVLGAFLLHWPNTARYCQILPVDLRIRASSINPGTP